MALIKVIESRNEADLLVHEVKSRNVAHLLVCKVSSRSKAKDNDALWCIVNVTSTATTKVCLIDSRAEADLLIYYVKSQSVAGWNKNHKMKGQLS